VKAHRQAGGQAPCCRKQLLLIIHARLGPEHSNPACPAHACCCCCCCWACWCRQDADRLQQVADGAAAECAADAMPCLLVVADRLAEAARELAEAEATDHQRKGEQPPSAAATGDSGGSDVGGSTGGGQGDSSLALSRRCLIFHHIKNLNKRKAIVQWGGELRLGGWSKPGFPGVVLVEVSTRCRPAVHSVHAAACCRRWRISQGLLPDLLGRCCPCCCCHHHHLCLLLHLCCAVPCIMLCCACRVLQLMLQSTYRACATCAGSRWQSGRSKTCLWAASRWVQGGGRAGPWQAEQGRLALVSCLAVAC